jgi:hypothetical protein
MLKTLLDKMFLKPDYSVAILNVPKELKTELYSSHKTDNILNGQYHFVFAFYNKEQDVKKEATTLKKSLLPQGLLWIAYPKNKALETDLNRDILHTLLKAYGLDGISIVSLNSTWSAMRFKSL